MKFLGLVLSNLKRKKLRTSLTILSIFVAFLLYAFLCAINEGFAAGVSLAGKDRLVVRHKVSLIQSLPFSYKARIRTVPGVSALAQQSWFGGIYQDPKNFFATIPVVPEELFDIFSEISLPEDQKQAWAKTRTGAIVGRATMKRFNWKIGDRIPLTSPIWGQPEGQPNWQLDIVGVYDAAKKNADTTTLFFRYDYFDEARTRGKGEVGWFTVRITDPERAAEIAEKIDAEFANSPYETKAEPEGAFAAGFAQQIGDIKTIVLGIVGAVFFTMLLVAGNTMAQAVRERTEELGVLKAMGFGNGLVLVLVLLESCIIAMIGGFAGLGIAILILSAGSPAPNVLPTLFLPPRDVVVGVFIVLALGIIAGFVPAVQAMRLRIAEALRRTV